jgi:hypothetical protein
MSVAGISQVIRVPPRAPVSLRGVLGVECSNTQSSQK